MTDVRGLQAHVYAAASEPTKDARVTQAQSLVGLRGSAQEVNATQAHVLVAEDSVGGNVRATQAQVLVAVTGRTDDPAVRAWTFTLDGHDFYVLRLGTKETLVYDMRSEQWYQWGTGVTDLWNVYHGENWIDGNNNGSFYGSNVLVGSDGDGSLFFLNPDSDLDSVAGGERDPATFRRRVIGQIALRGYNRQNLYEVQLIGTTGELEDTSLTGITLQYSDDRGDTYSAANTVNIPNLDYEARASWRSLGAFQSPGRLVRIEDDGALRRIDNLTIRTNKDPQ